MALIPSALAQKLLQATNNAKSAEIGLSNMGKAISEYLVQNAEITFSWNGAKSTSSPPVPDPLTIGNGKIISMPPITIIPSMATNKNTSNSNLGIQIALGISLGIYNLNPSWVTSPGMIGNMPPIKINLSGNNREKAMLQLATQIIDAIKKYKPVMPCVGLRGPFIGGIGKVIQIK